MAQVLLVDDNQRALEGLRRHIPWQTAGCTCVGVAADGVEALERVALLHPDVVITDVRMPRMDGLELCRQLAHQLPGARLIVLSAYDDFAYAQRAIEYGAVGYVLKPVDDRKIAELGRMLGGIAERQRQHAERLAAFYAADVAPALAAAVRAGDAAAARQRLHALLDPGAPFGAARDIASHALTVLLHELAASGQPATIAGLGLGQALAHLHALHATVPLRDALIAWYQQACQAISARRSPASRAIVARICAYLHEAYADPGITTYAIAQRFHISQSHLCQVFRAVEHTSIHARLTDIRIEHACRLLRDTGWPILEIARRTGYPDAQYFTRAFRRHRGIAPSDYRDRQRCP
jgi:two-component system response regulator YesN